jgi:DNA-directed RNA polymerase subunit RPC12/RpoP
MDSNTIESKPFITKQGKPSIKYLLVNCIKCGKERKVTVYMMKRPTYTGLCMHCLEEGGRAGVSKKKEVTCPKCGSKRRVRRSRYNQPDFKNICRSCSCKGIDSPQFHKACNEYRNKMANRSINERPQHKDKNGYLRMVLPSSHWCYPMVTQSSGLILVHRLVMAEYLERLIEPDEVVHHKDGNRSNNNINNLELTTRFGHRLSYTNGYKAGFVDAQKSQNEELLKHIKLLEWEIKQMREAGVRI